MSDTAVDAFGLASLSHIQINLDRLYGGGAWENWEPETISLDLNITLSDLARDKLGVLQVLKKDPESFYRDTVFFLHCVEVMNNKVADFESLPMPNGLELAYALVEADRLKIPADILKEKNSDIVETMAYLLKEDGFGEPVAPFKFIPSDMLEKGDQTLEDIEAKKKAIAIYVKYMSDL